MPGSADQSRRPACCRPPLVLAAFASLLAAAGPAPGPEPTYRGGTWSVVAMDRATGDVGVAAATCLPYDVSALAALVPSHGAAVIQADFEVDHRNAALALLPSGRTAEEIVAHLVASGDELILQRQFGVVTTHPGDDGVAGFSGQRIHAWSGRDESTHHAVTVQGNFLVGPDVVRDALAAFLAAGDGTLADRIMAGLEAGSLAGGDHRCNSGHDPQTASSAFIMVARGDQQPFATRHMAILESDHPERPWLHLSVVEEPGGQNPVVLLRQRYDTWRRAGRAGVDATAVPSDPGPAPLGAWRVGLALGLALGLAAALALRRRPWRSRSPIDRGG